MSSIDDQIQHAQQEGQFENLPGKGKPLRLDEAPLEDPEWRLANHLLHSSGYTLPWIEMRREIEADIQAARETLKRAWAWRQTALAEKRAGSEIQAEWQRAEETFRLLVEQINQRLCDYNLSVPSDKFQLLKLNVEKEIKAIAQAIAQANARPED
jgi:DnaJ homolog subfamily C member 28